MPGGSENEGEVFLGREDGLGPKIVGNMGSQVTCLLFEEKIVSDIEVNGG